MMSITSRWRLAIGALALIAALGVGAAGDKASGATAAQVAPYVLEVEDAQARVGEPANVRVRVRLRDGLRFLDAYRNRAIELSAEDRDSVEFGRRVVTGRLHGDTLMIEIPVVARKPGAHPINGVLRIGYAEGRRAMHMISVPLMGRVTGTSG